MDFKKKSKVAVFAKILVTVLWIAAVCAFVSAVLSFFVDVQIPEESELYGYNAVITEEIWH